ncbi:GntR family transcriptional regulator [Promicromonospora sp. NPDC050880]|uniref:GntR family transcriptional regulator n=1 Tax=unclassified Promicromonospora TaxID=2647929 RepID=UPI0037ADD989
MSSQQSAPPYRTIAAEIRARIVSGELRPGDRVPSVRQIALRRGVALATATRVIAVLRDEGLVESRVGSGTVVGVSAGRTVPARRDRPPALPLPSASVGPAQGQAERVLGRVDVVRAAIALADTEGLAAVTMRRLAAQLGVGPMSLYRHVANKDELLVEMADLAVGEAVLPDRLPPGWRARLTLVARRQWELCRRHPWLPRTVSFTRPLLVPAMMAHTEWTLRALDGLGLSPAVRMREALALHATVLTVALSVAAEAEAELDTGVTLDRWTVAHGARRRELLGSGRFPMLAATPERAGEDLDVLFEYVLARHLDGFAVLVGEPVSRPA